MPAEKTKEIVKIVCLQASFRRNFLFSISSLMFILHHYVNYEKKIQIKFKNLILITAEIILICIVFGVLWQASRGNETSDARSLKARLN